MEITDEKRFDYLAHDSRIIQSYNGGWKYGHMEFGDFIDDSEFYPTWRECLDAYILFVELVKPQEKTS